MNLSLVLGIILFFLVAVQGLAPLAHAAPRLIPTEDFFRNPDKSAYALSPNGEYVAFKMPWNGRENVFVQKVGAGAPVRVTSATERDVSGFVWAGDQRIVYAQDLGGDENFRLFSVRADGTQTKDLTPFPNVQVSIVDQPESNESEILIAMNKRDPKVSDVYRLNVDTGQLDLVAENPGNIVSWITDNDGKLRAGMASDGVDSTLYYRRTEAEPFRVVLTTGFKDAVFPLYFTFDNKLLYVSSNLGRDKRAFYTMDPESGQLLDLVFEHPDVDVGALLRFKHAKRITAATYSTDKLYYHFFDENRKQLQDYLEIKFPGKTVGIVGMSRDESRLLIYASSDLTPGSYYIYDAPTKELSKLADAAPWIKEEEMAPMRAISYTSRDGLTIHGYLTLPQGADASRLPTILLPHGGPSAKDSFGFNPFVQFLANRGYAVLQVNFRGSVGYGKAFWQAGFKEWGGKMQEDLTDAAAWLVAQGIADQSRLGIMGMSYGGYAALAGLTFTPELFACGVSIVGPTNILSTLDSLPPYWEPFRKMIYEQVGDPVKDKDMLIKVSPLFHADRIQSPVFIAHGANDPRVRKADSDKMVEALRARGVEVEYFSKENEGHGFQNEENRLDLLRDIERFLARRLGGKTEVRG